MIPDGFVNALVTYAEAKGETVTTQIETELDALFARVQAGKGKDMVTSTLNGKSFGFQVNMTVEEKFTAYAQAFRELSGGKITRTYGDFSGIQL